MNELLQLLQQSETIDSLYGFAYARTNNSASAEDLCSDIILQILIAARRNSNIENPHAFMWSIARRVYADFSEKRKSHTITGVPFAEEYFFGVDTIDEYIERTNDSEQVSAIIRQMQYLSRIYRDVCVMYYLDGMKVADIAARLGVSQNVVKQRLFTARKKIYNKTVDNETTENGEKNMTNLALKPIEIAFIGNGNPSGNDPRETASRTFAKNMIYLCRTERTIGELADLLSVPTTYVEEEVDILCRGANGRYGLLRKTKGGKYITNCIILDHTDCEGMKKLMAQPIQQVSDLFCDWVKENEKMLLDLPFLNKQTDIQLMLWPLLLSVEHYFVSHKGKAIGKEFANIESSNHEFVIFGIAYPQGTAYDGEFMGCNGTADNDLAGFKQVLTTVIDDGPLGNVMHLRDNIIYGNVLRRKILAASINGLAVDSLSDEEKEFAAELLEVEYIYNDGGKLYPRILISETRKGEWMPIYRNAIASLVPKLQIVAQAAADSLASEIKRLLPAHLQEDWWVMSDITPIRKALIEACFAHGTLNRPAKVPGPEGVFIEVIK